MSKDPVADALCGWRGCMKSILVSEPLCRQHMLMAWVHIEEQRKLQGTDRLEMLRESAGLMSTGTAPRPQASPGRESRVYYVQLKHGDIKIGYTADLVQRMRGLRLTLDDILATEPGGRELEKMRHAQFSHLRRTVRGEVTVDERAARNAHIDHLLDLVDAADTP